MLLHTSHVTYVIVHTTWSPLQSVGILCLVCRHHRTGVACISGTATDYVAVRDQLQQNYSESLKASINPFCSITGDWEQHLREPADGAHRSMLNIIHELWRIFNKLTWTLMPIKQLEYQSDWSPTSKPGSQIRARFIVWLWACSKFTRKLSFTKRHITVWSPLLRGTKQWQMWHKMQNEKHLMKLVTTCSGLKTLTQTVRLKRRK